MPTVGELNRGCLIRFGAYSVRGESRHSIRWIKVNDNNGIFLAQYAEDYLCFDAREEKNPLDWYASFGNPQYAVSNIHQFLNSEKDNWYRAQHEFDTSPTDRRAEGCGYYRHPGFLAFFSEKEKNALEVIDVKCSRWSYDDNEEITETIPVRVFLPSFSELYIDRGIDGDFDKREEDGWDLFKYGEFGITVRPTEEACSWACIPSGTCRYFTRSEMPRTKEVFTVVDYDRHYGRSAIYRAGIRPAICLKPDTELTDNVAEDGYYELRQAPQNEEEFLALFGA